MKRVIHAYDEYMAIIIQSGGHYQVHRWKSNKALKSFSARGHRYIIHREKALTLKGWYPWTRIHFFQAILDALSHRINNIGLLIYSEETVPNEEGYIEPLDRIHESAVNPQPSDVLSPDVHRVIGESQLYRDAMRKMAFGTNASWKTGTVLLVAMLFLMLVLYMGGYFG